MRILLLLHGGSFFARSEHELTRERTVHRDTFLLSGTGNGSSGVRAHVAVQDGLLEAPGNSLRQPGGNVLPSVDQHYEARY